MKVRNPISRALLPATLALVFFALTLRPCAAAQIGSRVTNFQLPDTSGINHSLNAYAGTVVALVFWSYRCPVSLAYIDRIEKLRGQYNLREVAVLAIASAPNETPAEIKANVTNLKISVPVLLDSEGTVAEKLGATHTPSVFILDGNAVLRYQGALDNNKRPGENGRVAYAEDALGAILSGRDLPVAQTKPFGCGMRQPGSRR
jgi:peroxiredoxin